VKRLANHRRWICALALLGAATALGACGSSGKSSSTASGSPAAATSSSSSSSSAKGGDFKVLYIGPMSGQLAIVGQAEKAGAQAAADVVNAQGGILGHHVTVTAMDDAGDGNKAVTVAKQVLADGVDKWNLILPGSFGSDAIPLAAVFAKAPVLQITQASEQELNNPGKYPNLYVPTSGYIPQETSLLQELKKKGLTKAAIVTGDTVSGHAEAEARQSVAKKVGVTITSTTYVPAGSVDATPQVQKALASKPQALTIAGFTPAVAPILAARAKLGSKLPVYMDAYASAADLGASTSKAARAGVMAQSYPHIVKGSPAEKTADWQAFEQAIRKYDPTPKISLIADLVTYDSVMMARAAAKKANAISGDAVAKALGTISTASEVPGFMAGQRLYSPTNHYWAGLPSDYVFSPAGKFVGGLIDPGT
jgi:branched-chain amino acid transport system substrate-binding protein